MQLFIADNEPRQVATLRGVLEAIDDKYQILPFPARAITRWSDVENELMASTEDSPDLVVILDLGLEPQDMTAVGTGVERAYQLRSMRPLAVFIAFTQFGLKAEHERHFQETFDGRIDKQHLHSQETFDEQVTYVRQILNASIRKRRKLDPRYKLKDSIGLRLAVAALGEDGIDYLVEEVARGWDEIQVAALSSGHSGAFLLAISGVRDAGPQRIIVKCARERTTIKNETRLVQEHLAELGPLGECMAQSEQVLHELPDRRGYYYRQAEVTGETLHSLLSQGPWDDQARARLDTVIRLELRCYEKSRGMPFGKARPNDLFSLKALDAGRATESLKLLQKAAQHCERLDQWPHNTPTSGEVAMGVQAVIDAWSTNLSKAQDLLVIGQHGDLNLGNIIVPSAGRVVFIDFSRLGRWPVGYDIGRLATMCRIHLTDAMTERHWIENNLKLWASEDFCVIDVTNNVDEAICPWAVYCDQRFGDFISTFQCDERRAIEFGYRLGSLSDLIKVLSYSDIPIFKRIWALIGSWRLARAIGFCA